MTSGQTSNVIKFNRRKNKQFLDGGPLKPLQ